MIAVSVLYPNRPDTEFDIRYYLQQHIPMVRGLFASALKGVTVRRGVSGDRTGSPIPYFVICDLFFDSIDDYRASFNSHAAQIMQDVPRYTNSAPIVQVSDVVLQ
jgi:uncharacterized protein (TIGR02118 family)